MQSVPLTFNPTTKAVKSPSTTFVGVWSLASEYKNVLYEKFLLKTIPVHLHYNLAEPPDKNRTDFIRAQSDSTIKLESVFADNGVLMLKY